MPSANTPEAGRRGACPECGRPTAPDHAPFCGQGCRDRDLLQWLSDGRAIPGAAPTDEDGFDTGDGLDRDGLDRGGGPSL